MSFQEESNILTSPEWRYFNQRIAEMGFKTLADIDAHGILFAPKESVAKYGIGSQKSRQDRPAIIFQYLNEYGQKLDMYQARMIGDGPDTSIPPAGMTVEAYKKVVRDNYPRYLGGKQYDAYFPLLPAGWENQPVLFITEGIPKAIRACKSGFPCISIQGKDQFKFKGSTVLVSGLERVVRWDKLQKIIYICDSDARKNESIKDAAVHLIGILNGRRQSNSFASFLILPDLPGLEKTGFDDYLNERSDKEFLENIPNWENKWEGGAFTELVAKIGDRIAHVENTTNFVNVQTRHLITQSAAVIMIQPLLASAGTIINPYSGVRIPAKAVSLTSSFLSDPFHHSYSGVDFWPGMQQRLLDDKFNLWSDCSPPEIEGDVSQFIKLLEFTIPNKEEQDLLLQLIAHRILHPEEKAPLAVFLFGGEGTGKSMLATSLFSAITDNPEYKHIGALDLSYGHENNHVHKQCVCIEEPTRTGMTNKDMESKYKLLIDSDEIVVNPKGLAPYKVKNRTLVWINTNDHYAPVSGAARRWLMIESPREANKPITDEYYQWMRATPNLGSRLRYWLKSKYPEIDVSTFKDRASKLDTKQLIVGENKPVAIVEYEEFLDGVPEELLELGCIPTRLLNMMPPYNRKEVSERQAITKILSTVYPLVKVGTSQDGKINVDGGTTSFRSTKPYKSFHSDSQALKGIYKKWEDHPQMKLVRSKF